MSNVELKVNSRLSVLTYTVLFRTIKSDAFTDAEKAAFLGENAVKLYGFKNLPELPYIKNMSE